MQERAGLTVAFAEASMRPRSPALPQPPRLP
jgi:hypothetical protein